MTPRRGSGYLVSGLALATLLCRPALAANPTSQLPNPCFADGLGPGGQGAPCSSSAGCTKNVYARLCIEEDPANRRCQIACGTATTSDPQGVQKDCAIGETCVSGHEPNRTNVVRFCKPAPFRVDLNLLDQCIVHYLDGIDPVFSGDENLCSLEANLNRLLDQNGDGVFDIFDVDLCVLAFLEQPGCTLGDPDLGQDPLDDASCAATDLLACAVDADCGRGLYCDGERHACLRDCGTIASREELVADLDRQCTGPGKVCNRERGRCEAVDVTQYTCLVDGDCPAGAYCHVGRCALNCYRSADCPSADWYCSLNNKCRARPLPCNDDGALWTCETDDDCASGYRCDLERGVCQRECATTTAFAPENYAVRFGRDSLALTAVQTFDRTTLVVMDILTKRQVVDNPSVVFGYRLEVSYGRKQDRKCLRPFVDCALASARPVGETEAQCTARQNDCYIDDTEEWIRLPSPFGTVAAMGSRGLSIELDAAVADRLSPGVYPATLRAIFDNGDSDTVPVTLTKTSPSGEYDGLLTIYKGRVENLLSGNRQQPFGLRLVVDQNDTLTWSELLSENNLGAAGENYFVDVTRGFRVKGLLHGNTSFLFTKSAARSTMDNEIPFVGLYSPDLGRMRLIGNIDIADDFCISPTGDCLNDDDTQLQVRNPFGRAIRRNVEFIGPFDDATGRFHGVYREKISGLAADFEVTLEGVFVLEQTYGDETDIALDPLEPETVTNVAYPSNDAVLRQLDETIERYCPASDTGIEATQKFLDKGTFRAYLRGARRTGPALPDSPLGRTTIFPNLRQFNSLIEQSLAALGTDDPTDPQDHLNIYDFLSRRLLPCDPDDPDAPPVCIDEEAVRCGLALHERAYLNGWIDVDEVLGVDEEVWQRAIFDPETGFYRDPLWGEVTFDASESVYVDGEGNEHTPIAPLTGEQDLFCPDTLSIEGCSDTAAADPEVFALQEHNRFWLDLAQILKFDGDRARSDAFLVLFRNEVNPFAVGAALSYKADRLREALERYDQVLEIVVGPAAGKTLFSWPARAFRQMGNDWLTIMQTVASDRMSVLADLVDLERRVFMSTSDTDFIFAQHLMQHEFLTQVYLLALQERWQREFFAYRGEATAVFEMGQGVLAQLNPAKNEIGVTPDRVFFENDDPSHTNWQHYRHILIGSDGAGGLVGDAEDTVADAVSNLQGALADLDTLEERLRDGRYEMEDRLNELCGNWQSDSKNRCAALLEEFRKDDTWKRVRDCALPTTTSGSTAPPSGYDTAFCSKYRHVCADEPDDAAYADTCRAVVNLYAAATDPLVSGGGESNPIAGGDYCALDAFVEYVEVEGRKRPCVGGEMGALIQEKARLDLGRNLVVGSVRTLLGKIQTLIVQLRDLGEEFHETEEQLAGLQTAALVLQGIDDQIDALLTLYNTTIEAGDCMMIFGLAVGTDCPQKIVTKFSKAAINTMQAILIAVLKAAKNALDRAAEAAQRYYAYDTAVDGLVAQIETLLRDLDGLIGETSALTQESFSVFAKIADLRYQAQAAAQRFEQRVSFVADHLVGRETGSFVLGDYLVAEASEQFREIMQYVYRMTVAFCYHYNLPPGDAATLRAQSTALVTLTDVKNFAWQLDVRARQYCGVEALDCDVATNVSVLRLSLREHLFPQLRDVFDAHTGALLSAGQQFHNLITQPPYLKRRVRGPYVVDQIEIPVGLPLTVRESTASGTPRWLIDPLSCNQMLDIRDPLWPTDAAMASGSLALNIRGKNLGEGDQADDDEGSPEPFSGEQRHTIAYEIVRGAVDYLRSCRLESVTEEFGTLPVQQYPIRQYVVGYAPQSSEGQRDAPASFATRSQPFLACINQREQAGDLVPTGEMAGPNCWRFFGRDRSLAAPDWKIVIPMYVDGGETANAWISGEGLAAAERPRIEDIVLYFRYRTRPVDDL